MLQVGHLGHRSCQASSEKGWGMTVHLVAVFQMGKWPVVSLEGAAQLDAWESGGLDPGLLQEFASLLTGGVVRSQSLLPCLEQGSSPGCAAQSGGVREQGTRYFR